MIHYTVITVIIDNYEIVHEVEHVSPNARYLLITDQPGLKSKTWEIIQDKNLTGSVINKVKDAKWNPWRYTDDEVVITLDGSISIKGNLDELVSEMLRQDKDMCLMVHPYRNTAREELNAWIRERGLEPAEARWQLKMMQAMDYDIDNYKGLYQQCFKIMRKTPAVFKWLNTVDKMLRMARSTDCLRTDQVLASFCLNKWFHNIPIMWVSQNILHGPYMTWNHHKSNMPILPTSFIEPYVFNRPLQL